MRFLRNRRRLVLASLFAGTVLAAVGSSEHDRPQDSPALAIPVHAARRDNVAALIDLAKLRRPAARSDVTNPLAARTWYVAPPPPKPLPPPPSPPPQAPPLPFVYMGKMHESGGPVVVFLVKDQHVHTVRVGDVVDATYKIEGLAGGALTFTYLPLNIQQTLLVGGGP